VGAETGQNGGRNGEYSLFLKKLCKMFGIFKWFTTFVLHFDSRLGVKDKFAF
jgi:hypothetical protein